MSRKKYKGKPRLCVSFSGGRTSAVMTHLLKKHLSHKYEIVVVFSNTGKEKEATLEFVRDCDINFGFNTVWVEPVTNPIKGEGMQAKIVNFEIANRTGEPFEQMLAKYGIPNINSPHCSRQLKGETVRAYCRSIGWIGQDYKTAIGIRKDEPARLNWKTAKENNLIYPLATIFPTTKSDVNKFWSKQTFDLKLKSYEGNCDLCWKKSLRKLMTIVKDEPKLADWWREMEQKYENFIPESKIDNEKMVPPFRFYRDNYSIDDIINEALFDFRPARDESNDIDGYIQSAL